MTRDTQNKIRLAIFASGSGSNAEAFMNRFEHHPSIKVALIVTNNSNAGVIDRAKRFHTEVLIIENERLKLPDFALDPILKHKIDWIVLAGWLKLIPPFLIEAYRNKIVNIHPALLPKFGGKGMYGKRVHQAVFDKKESESGITIHYVNSKFDEGEVIAQFKTSIDQTDSRESIEAKVRKLELEHYADVIENLVLTD